MSVRVMHPLIDLPLPTTIQQIPVWIQGMVAVKVISAQVQNMVMADSPVLIVTSFILPIVGDTYSWNMLELVGRNWNASAALVESDKNRNSSKQEKNIDEPHNWKVLRQRLEVLEGGTKASQLYDFFLS